MNAALPASPILLLLAGLCAALLEDLEIDECALLLYIVHEGEVPVRDCLATPFKRPREVLRRSHLIEFRDARIRPSREGRALATRILAAIGQPQPRELATA
jgi:hypothetical protein